MTSRRPVTTLPVPRGPSSTPRRIGEARPSSDGGSRLPVPYTAPPSAVSSGGASPAAAGADDERRLHWAPDDSAASCAVCLEAFGVTRRKHHCRDCGQVVCSDCSRRRMRLEDLGYTARVRVCDRCVATREHSESHNLAENLSVVERINEQLKRAVGEKARLLDQCRGFLLELEAEAAKFVTTRPKSAGRQRRGSGEWSDDEADDDSFDALLRQGRASLEHLVNNVGKIKTQLEEEKSRVQVLQRQVDKDDQEVSRLSEEVHRLEGLAEEREWLQQQLEDHRRLFITQQQQAAAYKQRLLKFEQKKSGKMPLDTPTAHDPFVMSTASSPVYASASLLGDFSMDREGGGSCGSLDSHSSSSIVVAYRLARGVEDASFARRRRRRCCRPFFCCCPRRRRTAKMDDIATPHDAWILPSSAPLLSANRRSGGKKAEEATEDLEGETPTERRSACVVQ